MCRGEVHLKLRDVAAAVNEAGIRVLCDQDYAATTFLTHPREAIQVRMTHDTYDPDQLDLFERE